MLTSWFNMALATIVALLPITNPVSTAALFMSITAKDSLEERRQQALRGVIYTFGILTVFLIAGTLIMRFFGISIPGLRIAGGVMVIRIAMSMLKAENGGVEKESEMEARQKQDISFTPLAMPSLSGPGAIAVTIGLSAGTRQWLDYTAIVFGILVVVGVAFITLRMSDRILNFFGTTGINALSKIMGFLLLCVGIQFIINATISILVSEEIISRLLETIQTSQ